MIMSICNKYELSSDFNMDEVDEQDLLILERFVLIQPSTLKSIIKIVVNIHLQNVPDLNTKYQCPIHESCLTPTQLQHQV